MNISLIRATMLVSIAISGIFGNGQPVRQTLPVDITDFKLPFVNEDDENPIFIECEGEAYNPIINLYYQMDLHGCYSEFKAYEDFRMISSVSSPQYKLIYSDEIEVGSDGLLYSGDYIGVALGTRYGEVGDKFEITLSSGQLMKVIKLDIKDDKHTTNGCHDINECNIELVIDTSKARLTYGESIFNGDFNNVFNGYITNMVKVVN